MILVRRVTVKWWLSVHKHWSCCWSHVGSTGVMLSHGIVHKMDVDTTVEDSLIVWCDIIPACPRVRATFVPPPLTLLTGAEGTSQKDNQSVLGPTVLSPTYIYSCICVLLFTCLTPGNIVIGVLVPMAFQKYSICMVYTDFILPGKNPPLGGGGGQKLL